MSNDVVVVLQGTGLVGLVDGSHLGWKMMSNDVVVVLQGTGLVGLVDGSHLGWKMMSNDVVVVLRTFYHPSHISSNSQPV